MEKLKVLFQNTLYIAYPLFTGFEGSERVISKWQLFYQDVEKDRRRFTTQLIHHRLRKASEMGF